MTLAGTLGKPIFSTLSSVRKSLLAVDSYIFLYTPLVLIFSSDLDILFTLHDFYIVFAFLYYFHLIHFESGIKKRLRLSHCSGSGGSIPPWFPDSFKARSRAFWTPSTRSGSSLTLIVKPCPFTGQNEPSSPSSPSARKVRGTASAGLEFPRCRSLPIPEDQWQTAFVVPFGHHKNRLGL